MSAYHIKEVEQLSGIKAHTLRIWEKRYNIIEPKRTSTNIRYYDDNDLRKILNISILNKNGFKISKIAKFNDRQLTGEILNLSQISNNVETQIGNLIKAMIDFDTLLFNKVFSQSVIQRGFKESILEVIHPFMKRIGILWLTGNIDPAQEHFISNIIRQKIIAAIDGLTAYPDTKSETFVLFLPNGEWHEIGLLLSSYLIKKNGHHDIYLGSSLPIESVSKLNRKMPFNNIVTVVGHSKSEDEILNKIAQLADQFPDKNIFIGGLQEDKTLKQKFPENIYLLGSIRDFDQYLKNRVNNLP